MQPPIAAALYAGLNALILVALVVGVVRLRGRRGVALGDGGAADLTRAIRAHGAAAETMPICLLMLALVELLGAPAWVVHALGLMLTAGQLARGWRIWFAPDNPGQRAAGMALTLAAMGLSALGLVGHALAGLSA